MKRYGRYKPSGVEWIGEIPEHWGLKKLRWVTSLLYGESLKSEDRETGDVPVYGSNGIVGYHSEAITSVPCLIIGRKGSHGKVNYSETSCFPIDTTYFIDVSATRNNLRWLFYVLPTLNLDALSKDSAVPGLSREEAYERTLPVPALIAEQTAIATYLDRKTAEIDDLIAKKRRLIDLLNEEKIAIINHTVTKGLNPDVSMKDSGILWIGQIPAHWGIKPLKYLLKPGKQGIRIGPFGSSLKSEFLSTSGYKVYGQENVINNDFELGWRYISEEKFLELSDYEIISGDVLITMMGTTGKCKVVPQGIEKGIMDSHLIRMRIDDIKFQSSLFADLINDSDYIFNQIKMMSKGSIMEGLNTSTIKQIMLVVPSRDEQDDIVQYLEIEIKKTNAAISAIKKEISLLQEYRTALISEAVTGKIDVRGAN
jgi:type I restriction enzyme S subunit